MHRPHTASTANSANSAQREAPWASAAGFGAVRNVLTLRIEGTAETQSMLDFAQFAESAAPQNSELTRMDIDTSQISHRHHVAAIPDVHLGIGALPLFMVVVVVVVSFVRFI